MRMVPKIGEGTREQMVGGVNSVKNGEWEEWKVASNYDYRNVYCGSSDTLWNLIVCDDSLKNQFVLIGKTPTILIATTASPTNMGNS